MKNVGPKITEIAVLLGILVTVVGIVTCHVVDGKLEATKKIAKFTSDIKQGRLPTPFVRVHYTNKRIFVEEVRHLKAMRIFFYGRDEEVLQVFEYKLIEDGQ